jgi:FkbH-like protein
VDQGGLRAGEDLIAMTDSTSPWQRLRELDRAGLLAAEFPAVGPLLAGLSPDELPRAGRLLARLDPDRVRQAHPAVPVLRVALTGHGTLGPLVPLLTAEFARHGMLPQVAAGAYNGYVTELGDPGSALYAGQPDLTLCVLDPLAVLEELPSPWGPADAARILDAKVALLAGLARRHEETLGRTLVLNTLPLPRRFAAQLIDHRSRARLGAAWREGNARLLRIAEDCPSVVVLDLDPVLAGGAAAADPRLSDYAKVHLSPDLLAAYAREAAHLARHLAGRTKKVLAVDLDGTLWGAVVGEDGVDGIEVGEGYRGEAFAGFQRAVRQIASQGVLLAAVSKNDPEPVREALRDHPGMAVREEDFVKVIANWRPKHENLAELAQSLNLSVDSFVFVDDSPYERGLVRHALPGVSVVAVGADPALHLDALLADGWFDTRELTAEDRGRGRAYRQETQRGEFTAGFASVAEYLRELGTQVRLAPVRDPEVPRLSQITLRTNQFNLTTERLQPADVRRLHADETRQVLAIHLADRFGDGGMVGAVLTRHGADGLHIENFLLSCRVFARGVEQACLSAVLEHARSTGVRAVYGQYRKTARNGLVADFYPRHGFVAAGGDEAGDAAATYRHDLASVPPPPEHIDLSAQLGGQVP